jgi:hypothetical protein
VKLLQTYEDGDDAQEAAAKLVGTVRVASERDAGETIYNLFGEPSWRNFYELNMYRLNELKSLLASRSSWTNEDAARHKEIVLSLAVVAKNFGVIVPGHWL